MASFGNQLILHCHTNLRMSLTTGHSQQGQHLHQSFTASIQSRHLHREEQGKEKGEEKPDHQSRSPSTMVCRRRSGVMSAAMALGAAAMLEARRPVQVAHADQSWGTRSFIKEKYFQPELSPEEAVARIRQTTDGLRDLRHMLDTMSWKYVRFYIRLKAAYLDSDLKNAMVTLPESRRKSYIKTANEVVDNMTEVINY